MLTAAIVSVDPFHERLRPGTGAAFVVLVAFLLSFLAIRTSAPLTRSVSWWPGGVESGGVHIHHLVRVADLVAHAAKEGGVLGLGGKEVSGEEQAVLDELSSKLATTRG